MKRHESGTLLSYCIVALLAAIVVPVGCSIIGLLHPAVSDEWKIADNDAGGYGEAYGAFCVCDARGHTYEVCAACYLQEDSCADLYLLQDTPGSKWHTMIDDRPDSLTIEGVRWFVCEEGMNPSVLKQKISVRTIYVQSGTLQTLGINAAFAKRIWAES